ncbi:MAG: peptide chain release factor N(5)-glutamine methyltransferase [Hyphomicrobiales bacterium]|nr:peptide chain release factor N(5)-glutamine methyltransferase [Hyphomicrobiales bacterium]
MAEAGFIPPGATVNEAVRGLTKRFAAAGLPTPALDARLIATHVLGVSRERLFLDAARTLETREADALQQAAMRRMAREPVSRITGVREFWGLPFKLAAATLDPRADSEAVVRAALNIVDATAGRQACVNILDVGTGTGCLLLALLHEAPNAVGVGCDASADALATARGNAEALGLAGRASFVLSHWLGGVDGVFDLVVSNPPYVETAEIARLEPEVAAHDPHLALDGGADGLEAYAAIVPALAGRLKTGGWALFEVGSGQARAVAEIMANHGFAEIAVTRDLNGVERVVAGKSTAAS